MEEDNDLEQVTGSPTAGENGFVHVESVDSAQTDSGGINQVENLEQDDGVVITGVDAVQDEPHTARTHEDGGADEFVDCPDDLVSNEARSPGSATLAHQQPFRDDTEDVQDKVTDNEKEITPQDYEEERRMLMKEVSNLHHQLRALSKQQSLIDESEPPDSSDPTSVTEGSGEKSSLPLREMVNECSKFVEFSMNDRLQSEGTIRELYATLHTKDKEIEDLMIHINEQSNLQVVVDRILSSIVTASGAAQLYDTSVSGKLSYLEENTIFLLQSYNYFVSEVEMLARCLAEVKADFQMENYMETVFPSVREELVGLKRKEIELNENNTVLTEQLDKSRETVELLNAEISKLKGEVEQEKTRYGNTKEKLSMAVTKGKALVQQRDQLKQLVGEKSDELERCLLELQEKSTALEAAELRNGELTQSQIFANSLQEALAQRDTVLEKCSVILYQGLPEVAQFPNLESQVSWLLESYNLAKDQAIKLHDENNAIKETASAQIDQLTASLLAESQDKHRLKEELEEIACKYQEPDIEVFEKIQSLLYVSDLESKISEQVLELELGKSSEELHASKDEMNSLQINLQRSEEKASLLREKLSMAVKKGKGLVQERENMRQQMAEKNAQIEALTVDFQKQESTLNNYRDQVVKLETERDQIGQFLAQSNSILQDIIEIVDGINIVFPSDLKEPVEKMKWFATYISECQVAKAEAEHEVGQLSSKLTEVLVNMKSYEDALSASEENISQLSEEKQELEASKIQLIEEIDVLNNKLMETLRTLKSLEDKLASSEETIGLLTDEKHELETAKCHIEEELQKAKDEITSQTSNISMLMREKEEAQMEVEKVKKDVSFHASNLDDGKKTIKSLEEELHRAMEEITSQTSNISMLMREKEEAKMEAQRVKEEASFHASNLDDAKKTVKSLEEVLHKAKEEITSQASNISMLMSEKEEAQIELEKVKKDVSCHASNLDDGQKTIRSLEEELHKAKEEITSQTSNISMLTREKEEAQMEVQRVKQEVTFHESNLDDAKKTIKSLEDSIFQLNADLSQFSHENEKAVGNRTVLESEIKKLKEEAEHEISTLKSELSTCRHELATLNDKWAPQLTGIVRNLQLLLKDESLLSLFKQSFDKNIEGLKEIDHVLKDMKDHFEENFESPTLLSAGFNYDWNTGMIDDEFNADDTENISSYVGKAFDNLNTKNRILANQFGNFSTLVDDTIAYLVKKLQAIRTELKKPGSMYDKSKEKVEELQVELEKSSSMYDKSKGVIEELQGELEKTGSMYEKVKEENDAFRKVVFSLENELEASKRTCNEMSSRLEDYQAKEDKWSERERELSVQSISSVKDHEDDVEKALLSSSQIKTLFDKINGITIPFQNLLDGDKQPQDSNPVEKLFYIIDNVNELLDQLTLLTHAKEDLRSTLSKQALEVDHLKGEFKNGLQKLIYKLGGDESVGVKKPADVAGLLLVLERLVQGIVLDGQSSKSKLLETQKIAEELSIKVKSMEDFIQNRTGGPDIIQERGVFGSSSFSAGSEISENDEQGTSGKVGLPLVPSAAQMRSLRKGSSEQLAITIDPESDRLLEKVETVQDKGHIFKSLNTSGLVPVQGKMIADRLDGIWVSGGQALMRRPRARLGLIAYWVMLHLWLLGTIL